MSQCEAAESSSQVNPQVIDGKERSSLDEVLRQGARQMLVQAVEAEVAAYIETHYCPVKSRIESAGWGHRVSFRGSRTAARPVKWAFSRKG